MRACSAPVQPSPSSVDIENMFSECESACPPSPISSSSFGVPGCSSPSSFGAVPSPGDGTVRVAELGWQWSRPSSGAAVEESPPTTCPDEAMRRDFLAEQEEEEREWRECAPYVDVDACYVTDSRDHHRELSEPRRSLEDSSERKRKRARV